MKRTYLTISLFAIMVSIVACSATKKTDRKAQAIISPKSGSSVQGTAIFEIDPEGKISLLLSLEGLDPNKTFGVHLHELGDCSAEDASSAGAHWNPTQKEHGRIGNANGSFHLGDIGNVTSNFDGRVRFFMQTNEWELSDNPNKSVIGKSIIVHEKADDFTTQPTGNSGKRIACGAIQLVK